jgi:hypothetical protein
MNHPTHPPSASIAHVSAWKEANTARADLVIRRTTVVTVFVLAVIAAAVSYGHMHTLALRHGQEAWSAALLPLSVDGMIVAASLALLSDSRRGERGGILPWTLLVIASGASLAANVAAADPTFISRVISAWPPFALIGAYEMLIRQIRHSVAGERDRRFMTGQPVLTLRSQAAGRSNQAAPGLGRESAVTQPPYAGDFKRRRPAAERRQREAWQWALDHPLPNGELPTGEAIAEAFQRSARWGRLVKSAGLGGEYDHRPERQAA